MSLRDSMLKAGLVTKQAARKAEAEERQKKKQQGRKTIAEPTQAQLTADQQRAKDKALNLEKEAQRKAKESEQRILDILNAHDQCLRSATNPYFFVDGGRWAKRIFVTDEQLMALAAGAMGISKSPNDEDEYYLLLEDACRKIQSLRPELICCFHQGGTPEADATSSK